MPVPVFSVVMPCFNCEATLAHAVNSVLAQSFTDFEIVLVDDGSCDGTLTLALSLAAEDERIRVLIQPNGGVARARNRGVAQSRGRLIAFLDADDWWAEDKLALHYALHAADDLVDLTFAGILFMPDHAGKAITCSTVPQGALSLVQVLGENPVCTMSNVVVRKDAFDDHGPFRAGMSYAEDQEWLARIVAGGGLVVGIDRQLVFYRTSEAGLSSDLEKMYDGWKSFAYDYAPNEIVRKCDAIYCRYLARRALRLPNSSTSALHYTLIGLRLDAASFLSDPYRGGTTALASLFAAAMPNLFRTKIFA